MVLFLLVCRFFARPGEKTTHGELRITSKQKSNADYDPGSLLVIDGICE
jgi:hypothetical protein